MAPMKSENPALKSYIQGRSCVLLGLGVSNLPLARQLVAMGVPLTVRDRRTPYELGEEAIRLQKEGVRFLSEDAEDCLCGKLIFRSPGIRPDLPSLLAAQEAGAELTSEIELFLKLTQNDTFAVTGSDGKTTSTTLTGLFLEAEMNRRGHGQVLVGGNIGAPLLDRLPELGPQDPVVMELSSFQLMTLKDSPTYAAVTNLSPNHLDWHENMEEYVQAKRRIVGPRTRRLVINADCNPTARLAQDLLLRRSQGENTPALYLFSSRKTSFQEIFKDGFGPKDRALFERNGILYVADAKVETPLLNVDAIGVPGQHNIENFMTAMGLTLGAVDPAVYPTVAASFRGVAHRLEWIRRFEGVDYYNSSIDSSPTRTAAALSALSGRDVVIICGGYDKRIPFEPLADALISHVRAVVLTGATAKKIQEAILRHPRYHAGHPEILQVRSFEDAVRQAKDLARPEGCVLLSPACASFDAFRNFAHRGDTFRKIVESFEN